VTSDLTALTCVVDGKEKANNHVRDLVKALRKDRLPAGWLAAVKDQHTSVWIEDFMKRLEHVARIIKSPIREYGNQRVWLGGFFNPEAFVAASRQAVAAAHGWSLETLYLKVTVNDTSTAADSFTFEGLTLQGSSFKGNALALSDEVSQPLPPTRFTWVRRDPSRTTQQHEEEEAARGELYATIPVYYDSTRRTFLFSMRLPRPKNVSAAVFSQRGTCVTVWSPPS